MEVAKIFPHLSTNNRIDAVVCFEILYVRASYLALLSLAINTNHFQADAHHLVRSVNVDRYFAGEAGAAGMF